MMARNVIYHRAESPEAALVQWCHPMVRLSGLTCCVVQVDWLNRITRELREKLWVASNQPSSGDGYFKWVYCKSIDFRIESQDSPVSSDGRDIFQEWCIPWRILLFVPFTKCIYCIGQVISKKAVLLDRSCPGNIRGTGLIHVNKSMWF